MEERKTLPHDRDLEIEKSWKGTKSQLKCFHVVANQRRRKNHLSVLEGPDGRVYSTKDILDVATNFYKNLCGFEPKPTIHLGDQLWSAEELVIDSENEMLENPFLRNFFKETIMGSYASGAPSPDG